MKDMPVVGKKNSVLREVVACIDIVDSVLGDLGIIF